MMARAKGWHVLLILGFIVALAAGCSQHYYAPGATGPDNLRVSVQYRWSAAPTYNIWASAFVTRPDGSYQRVDNMKIWVRTVDLKDYAENYGQSEVSVHTYRPVAPSDQPKAYACATYRGQTFCAGDQAAQQ